MPHTLCICFHVGNQSLFSIPCYSTSMSTGFSSDSHLFNWCINPLCNKTTATHCGFDRSILFCDSWKIILTSNFAPDWSCCQWIHNIASTWQSKKYSICFRFSGNQFCLHIWRRFKWELNIQQTRNSQRKPSRLSQMSFIKAEMYPHDM